MSISLKKDLRILNESSGLPIPLNARFEQIEEINGIKKNNFFNPRISDYLDFDKLEKQRNKIVKAFVRANFSLEDFTIPKGKSPSLDLHVLVFREKLLLWKKLPIKKSICAEEIFYNSLTKGPAFAKFLDKCKHYTYISVMSDVNYDPPEEYVLEDYDGYDSIYPPSHLIHWIEKSNDAVYSLLPDTIEKRDLEAFEVRLRQMLKKVNQSMIERWTQKDEVSVPTTSSSYNVTTNSSNAHYDIYAESVETDCMIGRECNINVAPANVRDVIVSAPDDLPKIKRLHKFLSQVLDQIPYSAMLTDPNLASKRIQSLKLEGHFFYMLDIKKCGITMSRKLMRCIANVMSEIFKDFKYESEILIQIVESRFLYDEVMINPNRGFNLGWANEIPTLIQCVLLSMYNTLSRERRLRGVFFNDDSVLYERIPRDLRINSHTSRPEEVRIKQISYMEYRLDSLIRFFSKYLYLNTKKIFASSRGNVFCEIYWNLDDSLDFNKNSLGLCSILDIMKCHNISTAKRIMNSTIQMLLPTFDSEVFNEAFNRVVKYFGYEFYKTEFRYPYEFGGWYTAYKSGNPCIVNYYDVRDNFRNDAAYVASKLIEIKLKVIRLEPKNSMSNYKVNKLNKYSNVSEYDQDYITSSQTFTEIREEYETKEQITTLFSGLCEAGGIDYGSYFIGLVSKFKRLTKSDFDRG